MYQPPINHSMMQDPYYNPNAYPPTSYPPTMSYTSPPPMAYQPMYAPPPMPPPQLPPMESQLVTVTGGEWKHSMFDCFNDCGTCCKSCLCPCVQYGLNNERLYKKDGCGCFMDAVIYTLCAPFFISFCLAGNSRGDLRKKTGIPVRDCY
jgi:Cys-rich protein (TIGR01571 family)